MERLKAVAPVGTNYVLRLVWEDGTEQEADLSGLVHSSRHFHVFKEDIDAFRTVKTTNWGHGVAWDNGLDYSAENLRQLTDQQAVAEITLVEFAKKYALKTEEAGAVLGYRRSQAFKLAQPGNTLPYCAQFTAREMMRHPVKLYARLATIS